MKVRVTFDISNNQRLGLNLLMNGKLEPANREDMEAWLHDTVDVQLTDIESKFDDAFTELKERLALP